LTDSLHERERRQELSRLLSSATVRQRPSVTHLNIKRTALRISEVMALTALSRSTIYRRIDDGTFSVVRVGKTPLIKAACLNKLLGGE